MWLFTPFGFFSVVAHRHEPEMLLVRSRARADLGSLLAELEGDDAHVPIQRTPDADYPYRVTLRRETVVELMTRFVMTGLDYPNFKNAVADRQGYERASTYHDVWEVVTRTEDREARQSRRPAARPR